jgi:cellulose synthase operon protein C
MTKRAYIVTAIALAALAAPAAAQVTEVEVDRGPTSELYIRKRPPAPAAPVLSAELRTLLGSAEKKRDAKRVEAIGLLRTFLDGKPSGDSRAQGLFKLAELLWEEARRTYLVRMDAYSRALEACRQKTSKTSKGCARPPAEPRIDLREPEKLYRTLLAEHPDFARNDLAMFLVGFAAKEDEREDDAMQMFTGLIERYPQSPLYGDAWMMVGDHHFAREKWSEARDAYANVLSRPDAATYDVALFYTAWCDWKLGQVESAAKRFKEVLDLAVEAERAGSSSVRRRRASLRDEALEQLVVVFTEDRSISAKEVFDFLASIGGERYSRDVLVKVADSYVGQAEYDRATDTFAFLVKMDPDAIGAAAWQRRIVETWGMALDAERAGAELEVLLTTYGPESAWAKKQRNREALTRSLAATEALARGTAQNAMADAYQAEKASKKVDRGRYERAAGLMAVYLQAFGTVKPPTPYVVEAHFLRGQALFKLGRFEEAGDAYLAAGKTPPIRKGEMKRQKDALLNAMEMFEKARPQGTAGKRQLLPVDRKFAESVDLYATLFPADPALVDVVYRNGQLFFDYGDYDEAIKRFGLIVTKYPDHEKAGPAGDRILKALAQAQDYETIEEWARKLKGAKAFASKDQQERLDRLIVESIGKSGEKYAAAGKYDQAAGFYLRIPKEFPGHKLAAASMMNAGVMYEKAKQPEKAGEVYLGLADKYPQSAEADRAAFAAGVVYERVAYFDRAAESFEVVVAKFPRSDKGADALYNAGVLRQALGQHDKAIAHYQAYARRHKDRKDASDVAFRIGEVYEEAGDSARAEQAFRGYAKTYRDGKRSIEAHVRAGRTALRQGQLRRAESAIDDALSEWKRAGRSEQDAMRPWAAEARYLQGELLFRDYEKVTLNVKPRDLSKTLKKKAAALDKAQKVYLDVVEFEDLKWATAALYRVGQIYDGFAESLVSAPTPQGLSEAEAAAYREALDTYVIEIQDKALQLFSAGYQKAIQMQVYDQYTAKIREALGRLAADKYPPERESRSRERQGDRPLAPELVTEVAR